MVRGPPFRCIFDHCDNEEETLEEAKEHHRTHRVVKEYDENNKLIRRVV